MAAPRLAVIGQGYVGLPLACALADKGNKVVGVDVDAKKVRTINSGRSPMAGKEPGLDELLLKVVNSQSLVAVTDIVKARGSKAFFVCVDTPVGKDKKADLTILKTVSVQLGKVLGKGCLVSVESTLPPRTMTDVVIPLLEEGQGLKAGRDFHVVHCPERVMPGRLLLNMKSYSRVLGGIDQASIEAALVYYRQLVEAEIFPTDLTSAELCKTVENTYRDVQIAFANEVALICEQLGADAYNVRRLVNTCPFRDMHLPGSGVGGHCLTKDPWLLLSAVNEADGLISRARQINDSMPEHLADLVEESLKEAGIKLKDARLSVMGLSFLRDSDETRNSPSKVVIDRFDGKAKAVVVHDPFAQESYKVKITRQVEEALRGSDCAIFVTDHSEYLRLDLKRIKAQMRTPIIVDGRNIFNAEKCRAAGLAYRGIGKGAKPKVTSGRKGGK